MSLCTASMFSKRLNIFPIAKYTPGTDSTTEAKMKTLTGTVKQSRQANYLTYYIYTLDFLVITKE